MKIHRKAMQVLLAGVGVNLALGLLYSWSVLAGGIPESWGWSAADRALPFSVACFVFALSMIPAGRLQDRFGPRWVVVAGGLLMGGGLVVSSLAGSSLLIFVIGFGGLTGAGIGFGYAAATPAAVKWFPPARTGLIAGLVVAGFGLASVYIAPLANAMLGRYGLSETLMYLGVAFAAAVVLLGLAIRNPPAGYVPRDGPVDAQAAATPTTSAVVRDMTWRQILRTPQFWVLWLMFAFGSATGLMLIGIAKPLGTLSLGAAAFWVVVVLSIGNAGGRVLAGALSDRIGRQRTLFAAFMLQALMVLSLLFVQSSALLLLIIIALAGANYGANMALFPSATKDYFGLKGFGLNYGIMFTAWGVGGLILPRINGMIIDATGSSRITFLLAGGLMLAAAMLTFLSQALEDRALQPGDAGREETPSDPRPANVPLR